MPVNVKTDFILDEDEHGEFCVIMLRSKREVFAKIDVEDFADISRFQWYFIFVRKYPHLRYAYKRRKEGEKRIFEYMHRYLTKVKSGVFIDHINGNGLDNRRSNLRVATNSQNQMNVTATRGRSKFKGIYLTKDRDKWAARIRCNGKRFWLGTFACDVIDGIDRGEIRAAKAYDKNARLHFGVFARLNFPELGDDVMSYTMTEEHKKKAYQLISNCSGENLADIGSSVGDCSVEELELMCRYCECNISKLPERIKSMRPRGYTEAVTSANGLGGK